MKRWGWVVGAVLLVQGAGLLAQKSATGSCQRVVFEGDVKAGQAFSQDFAKGLRFYLEPLPSGWIVRVLSTTIPRGPHDYAELATPPYKSVSPLLISTDWAFRSQDAVAWNPRRFRYAGSAAAFHTLEGLYGAVMTNDTRAMGKASRIVAEQPEAVLEITDARLAAGLGDQSKMASMVAENLQRTPHTVDQGATGSPLGRIEELRFRVTMTLGRGMAPAGGLHAEKISCSIPTA